VAQELRWGPRQLLAASSVVLLALAAPARSAAAPRAVPRVALPPASVLATGSVEELLQRRGRPDLYADGPAECLAYLADGPGEPTVSWYLFPRSREAGRPRVVQGLAPDARAAVEAACGPEAGRFARVVHATCVAPASLLELLRDEQLLSWRPPALPAALRWAPLAEPGHLALAEEIGCARVVAARDGRVRAWIPLRERLAGPGEAGAGGGVLRGLAFVQARLPDGRVAVFRDRARGHDLHLDTVVDALEPLPGPRPRYLVVGARTFDAPAPGALPRRYAYVMEVDGEGPRLVRGQFAVGATRRDLLLLQGASPPAGVFRFHALRVRHLAFSPADGALSLSAFDGRRLVGAPGDGLAPAVVARLQDGLFRVEAVRWEATAERPGDARVWLADRWGGVEEVGLRGLDEGLWRGGLSSRAAPAALDAVAVAAR
jgi:hypothetical protein